MVKLNDLPPSHLWRYLVQRYFQRTYPETPVMVANAVVLLHAWLKPTDIVFEWGSGRSTSWLAPRVSKLISVEHNLGWYEKVNRKLFETGFADRVDYRYVEAPGDQMHEPVDSPYARAIDPIPENSLDVVLIDGQMRLRCAQKSLAKLKPQGLLVLDGANRYVPNTFSGQSLTLRVHQNKPLSKEWADLLEQLSCWRAIHTTDFLWDTRMWVKPPKH